MVVGLSAIALSQATVPQLYVLSAIPGDKGLATQTVQISPPLKLTRVAGRLYLSIDPDVIPTQVDFRAPLTTMHDGDGDHVGLDPGALGVTVQLDGKTIGTTRILNIVSGPGIMPIAIQADGKITIQLAFAAACVPDTSIPPNWTCNGPSAVPVAAPSTATPK